MIISRTPLRMSFVGGGSDMAVFYREHGGAVLSTAIDKYVYVNVNRKFDGGTRIAYSKNEEVASVAEIEHRLVRATFEELGVTGGVEIATIADIPSRGTGLGSSSSFTVGLINALTAYQGRHVSADELGRMSSEIEIERCGEPIGKQDQYAAAFGGFNLIEFRRDDSVVVTPVIIQRDQRELLESRIIIFYTGITRSASDILKDQTAGVANEQTKRDTLSRMVELTFKLHKDLSQGSLGSFGHILHENWELKKSLTSRVSTCDIDNWYDQARAAGAEGGKLLGAGSGGFMMFYAPEDTHDRIAERLHFLRRVKFKFEPLGSRIIFYNPTS
jgi:D-glycero-alpha-D-manno-heptose-7-phosphate kinase